MIGWILSWDKAVELWANSFAGKSTLLDVMIRLVASSALPWIFAAALLALLFVRVGKRDILTQRRMVVWAFISGVVARFLFTPIVRIFFPRTRPYLYLPIDLLGPQSVEKSFPSGHAVFFFALAFMVYQFDKKIGYVFLAAATLIGVARVFAGIHFPLDIIAGALLGWITSVALDIFLVAKK